MIYCGQNVYLIFWIPLSKNGLKQTNMKCLGRTCRTKQIWCSYNLGCLGYFETDFNCNIKESSEQTLIEMSISNGVLCNLRTS